MQRNSVKIVYQLAFLAGLSLLAACEKLTTEQRLAKLHLPVSNVVVDPGLGKSIYQGKCLACHGIGVRGTDKGPPLVHRTYRQRHHPDTAFHLAVKYGVKQHHWHFGHMPPVDGITPEQVEHVISYVRNEQRRAGIR